MDDTSFDRRFQANLAVRIAASVPVLVVKLNSGQVGSKAMDALKDSPPYSGVGLHDRELVIVEPSWFLENPIRNADFADVVQKGSHADFFDLRRGEAEGMGDLG